MLRYQGGSDGGAGSSKIKMKHMNADQEEILELYDGDDDGGDHNLNHRGEGGGGGGGGF